MAVKPNSKLMKEKRMKLNMTQIDVAWKLQQMGIRMTDSHYSRIERGDKDYRDIKVNTACAIAHILEEPVEKLFIFTPDKEAEDDLTPFQKKKIKQDALPDIKKAIGKQLRAVRKQRKIPVQEIAEHIECHPSYIYHIENGTGSIESMRKYGELVGVDVEELSKLEQPLEK